MGGFGETMVNKLWEILVPTIRNDGRPIKTMFHRVWDKKVRDITGGLTVMPPNVSGQWVNPEGHLFKERMIPVRIMATAEQMNRIADMTMEYYEQEAVMFYVISEQVYIKYTGFSPA